MSPMLTICHELRNRICGRFLALSAAKDDETQVTAALGAIGGFGDDGALDALVRIAGVDPRKLDVHLLSPLDLAVSKLSRFEEHDREDIAALAREGLIDARSLRRRAQDALPSYVGNIDRVKSSIDIACRLVEKSVPKRPRPN